jgi:hypothetical protein
MGKGEKALLIILSSFSTFISLMLWWRNMVISEIKYLGL